MKNKIKTKEKKRNSLDLNRRKKNTFKGGLSETLVTGVVYVLHLMQQSVRSLDMKCVMTAVKHLETKPTVNQSGVFVGNELRLKGWRTAYRDQVRDAPYQKKFRKGFFRCSAS